jgi:uncharacterized membrane protein
VTRIREEVEIEAPLETVWTVVHEDLKNAPRWTGNLERAELLNDGPPGKGSEIRYHLKLPGGHRVQLDVLQTTYNKPKRVAGHFTKGPLEGEWSYAYAERDGVTRLIYEMDYQLGGMMRFVGGAFRNAYAAGIRDNMRSLKRYIESGKMPRPAARTKTKARRPALS